MALSAVKTSERKKPPVSRTSSRSQCGVDGVNSAEAPRNAPEMRPMTISVWRKPNQRSAVVAVNFIISAPAAAAKVIEPEANGLRPKPICSRSGSRNGMAPTPMRKMNPPTTPAKKVGIESSLRSRIASSFLPACRT